MGIYDRDYYRNRPPQRLFSFSLWSITPWLIILNVGVFILDGLLKPIVLVRQGIFFMQTSRVRPLDWYGFFSIDQAIHHWELWRFFSYQFLHANLGHLLGNMLALFFFGPVVERYLGVRRFIAFYLLCGMSGAVVFTLAYYIGMPIAGPYSQLVGASAGIFGVLVAAAMIAPDMEVFFLFFPAPMQLKYLALIMLGLAVFTTFSNGQNAGGEAAHLGGAALGVIFMQWPWLLTPFDFSWVARHRRPRMRVRFADWSKDMNH